MLLIVSAIPSEIESLVELTEATRNHVEPTVYFSSKYNVLMAPVGIGFLNAALGLQKILFGKKKVRKVIFCGTAGVYPDHESSFPVGESVQASGTTLFDSASELEQSRYPSLLKEERFDASGAREELATARVATVMGITATEELASRISTSGHCEVENMELYGIAKVCSDYQVEWSAQLGITNVVGSQGHKQWMCHHKRIEQKNSEVLFNYICHLKE